jgi:alkylresorcinol/alkylpyrone synthase
LHTSQQQVKEILTRHYTESSPRSLALLQKVLDHPSIGQRCFAFDSPESIFNEDPDERIARFTRWAVDLSAEAVTTAMREAGLAMTDIAGIVVNTCTGYICPGLSTYLVERLGSMAYPRLRPGGKRVRRRSPTAGGRSAPASHG